MARIVGLAAAVVWVLVTLYGDLDGRWWYLLYLVATWTLIILFVRWIWSTVDEWRDR